MLHAEIGTGKVPSAFYRERPVWWKGGRSGTLRITLEQSAEHLPASKPNRSLPVITEGALLDAAERPEPEKYLLQPGKESGTTEQHASSLWKISRFMRRMRAFLLPFLQVHSSFFIHKKTGGNPL